MAKAIKYENEFSGVSADSIADAINAIGDFVTSLNAVDYSSSGCFAMSTNAKYDGTFNNGIEYLKGTDIVSMVTLCNSCNTVLSSIQIYLKKYSDYEDEYNIYIVPNMTNMIVQLQLILNGKKMAKKAQSQLCYQSQAVLI